MAWMGEFLLWDGWDRVTGLYLDGWDRVIVLYWDGWDRVSFILGWVG